MRTPLVAAAFCLASVACSASVHSTTPGGDDASASGGGADSGASGSSGGSSGGSGSSSGAGGPGEEAGTSSGAGSSGGTSSVGDAGSDGAIPRPYCNGTSADLTTDSLNCGSCGTVCQPTGVAYNLNAPYSVIEDSKNIYWAEQIASGRIFQVPLGTANTANPTAIAMGQKNPRSLAVDATNVYWLTDNGVMKRPIAGGAAVSIAGESGGRPPGALTLDATSLYWTTHSDTSPNYADVKKMPLGGGAAVELATLPDVDFTSIAVDSANVYWVYTYYESLTSGIRDVYIYKAPLAGGTPVVAYQSTGYADIDFIVTDAKYLYFTTYESDPSVPPQTFTTGTLLRMPLAGGKPEPLDTDLNWPVGVGLNAQGAFWATTTAAMPAGVGGSVRFTPTGVGTPFSLAWNSEPTSLSVTSTHMYLTSWVNNKTTNGTVTRFSLCVNSVCQ